MSTITRAIYLQDLDELRIIRIVADNSIVTKINNILTPTFIRQAAMEQIKNSSVGKHLGRKRSYYGNLKFQFVYSKFGIPSRVFIYSFIY